MPQTFATFTNTRRTEVALHNAPALPVLADPSRIPDGSVDLVLTDPPYIISRESGFDHTRADGSGGGLKRFHSYQTDFGAWDREGGFTMDDLAATVAALPRVLRPGGTAIVFFDIWKISPLAEMMQAAGFVGIEMIEWVKTNPVPVNSKRTYLSNAREVALVGHLPEGEGPGMTATRRGGPRDGIYRYPIYHAKDRFHPTQKSLPLFKELLRNYSRQGDTVLDCFSGSATTGVAAIGAGRHYIGCEPDPDCFAKSRARLITAIHAHDAREVA